MSSVSRLRRDQRSTQGKREKIEDVVLPQLALRNSLLLGREHGEPRVGSFRQRGRRGKTECGDERAEG